MCGPMNSHSCASARALTFHEAHKISWSAQTRKHTCAGTCLPHLNIPYCAGGVDAAGAQVLRIRFTPVKGGERGAEVALLVLHG